MEEFVQKMNELTDVWDHRIVTNESQQRQLNISSKDYFNLLNFARDHVSVGYYSAGGRFYYKNWLISMDKSLKSGEITIGIRYNFNKET